MAVICPAILAADADTYHLEVERVGKLVERIHIDLTDGRFAEAPTVTPEQAWWPVGVKADFHLMYDNPLPAVKTILTHQANLIIVHAEASGSFRDVVDWCRQVGARVGVALLPSTAVEKIAPSIEMIDHVLVFSGNLGSYGGHSDLTLLSKVQRLKELNPGIEVGWDGGINDRNTKALIEGGVDVLNVGGFVQKAENPAKALNDLQDIARSISSDGT